MSFDGIFSDRHIRMQSWQHHTWFNWCNWWKTNVIDSCFFHTNVKSQCEKPFGLTSTHVFPMWIQQSEGSSGALFNEWVTDGWLLTRVALEETWEITHFSREKSDPQNFLLGSPGNLLIHIQRSKLGETEETGQFCFSTFGYSNPIKVGRSWGRSTSKFRQI